MIQRLWHESTRRRTDDWRDDAWTAAGVFAIGVLFLSIGIDETWGDAPAEPPGAGWQVVLLVAATAPLLFKRRLPIMMLLVVGAVFAVDLWHGEQLGVLIALIEAVHSAARRAGPIAVRVLRQVLVTLILGGAATAYLAFEDLKWAVLLGLQVFAVLGTPYWWGLAVRREAETAALIEERARDERRLAEVSHAETLRTERSRMAADLHDALSGNLSAIALHAEAMLVRSERDSADRAGLQTVRESSVRALSELQSMVLLLRADDMQHERASPRLPGRDALIGELGRLGLEVGSVVVSDSVDGLPAVVDQAAHRIVQESLTNAAKHASGGTVDVELTISETCLSIVVRSTGDMPTDQPPGGPGLGVGLVSMRERAERNGGEFDAGWEADRWKVSARIPLVEVGQ